MTGHRNSRLGRRAFTLIELMVVIAIVGILIGAVFQLLNTVGQMNQKAETAARLQRIQNAISGFYAEYGYYPPVPRYSSPDPWATGQEDDYGDALPPAGNEAGFASRASTAARSQPVTFEFPPVKGLDEYINRSFDEWRVMSPNTILGPNVQGIPKSEWEDIKVFKFGLLSFLLPRVELVGFTGLSATDNNLEPNINFYKSRQWRKHNPVSDISSERKALQAQQIIENRATARWLPNLEGIVAAGRTLLGIDLHEPYTAGSEGAYRISEIKDGTGKVIDMKAYDQNGQKYVLQYVSLRDGWDRDFFYYSPPPYQSYRIWSAGKDGRTFPPWIAIENLSSQERAWAAEWIADDIVRFDH